MKGETVKGVVLLLRNNLQIPHRLNPFNEERCARQYTLLWRKLCKTSPSTTLHSKYVYYRSVKTVMF